MLLGRFHFVRVLFGTVIVGLCFVIFYQNLFKDNGQVSGVIKVSAEAIQETWMTLDEFVQLARANTTCPVCFGRDKCDDIISGISKGSIGISRKPLKDPISGQFSAHQVYKLKSGKVKFWLRPTVASPSFVSGFEEFVCRNASLIDKKTKKSVKKCDVSVAAKSTFLFTSTLDLNSLRGIYRAHLVSPRRLPLTICPTYKLVRGLVEAFDEDGDMTLTAEEKAVLISTVAVNPDVAVYKFILNQKLQFPVLPFFGSCGRVTFIQGPHKPLESYLQDPVAVRLDLASQVLQLVDSFIHDDPNWLLFTTDISFGNLVVTRNENQVFLRDLSNVMLLDKDILDTPELPETKKPDPDKTGNCGDDCFNEFYDKLTQRKDEKTASNSEDDGSLSSMFSECSKIWEMAGHMYTMACRMVLSDLPADVAHRKSEKRLQGLLHSIHMSSAEGLKLNEADVERLLTRCSNDPNVAIRSEAALELIEVLSGSHEKNESEDEAENEDFNDNNIQFNENEDFHQNEIGDGVNDGDDEGGELLPNKLIQEKP